MSQLVNIGQLPKGDADIERWKQNAHVWTNIKLTTLWKTIRPTQSTICVAANVNHENNMLFACFCKIYIILKYV